MNEQLDQNLRTIIEFYGEKNQLHKAVEELEELKKELLQKEVSRERVAEEIADVLVMIRQLLIIFELDKYDLGAIMDYKVLRTLIRMDDAAK